MGLVLSLSVRISGGVDLGLVLMAILCLCMAFASVMVPQRFLEETRKSDEPQLELRAPASDISQTGSASTRMLSKLLIVVIALFLFLHVSVEIAYCKETGRRDRDAKRLTSSLLLSWLVVCVCAEAPPRKQVRAVLSQFAFLGNDCALSRRGTSSGMYSLRTLFLFTK